MSNPMIGERRPPCYFCSVRPGDGKSAPGEPSCCSRCRPEEAPPSGGAPDLRDHSLDEEWKQMLAPFAASEKTECNCSDCRSRKAHRAAIGAQDVTKISDLDRRLLASLVAKPFYDDWLSKALSGWALPPEGFRYVSVDDLRDI